MPIRTRSYQIGIDADKNKNFVLKTPPIPDGSIALYRGNADDLGDKVWEVDAQGNFKAKTIHLGEAVSLSGKTFQDFTIPEGVKRATLMFSGVSTNGNSKIITQLGDSSGIYNSTYVSRIVYAVGSAFGVDSDSVLGFVTASTTAETVNSGKVGLESTSQHVWQAYMSVIQENAPASGNGVGRKTISNTLTTVRITTENGTDQFDAGTVNISWEY